MPHWNPPFAAGPLSNAPLGSNVATPQRARGGDFNKPVRNNEDWLESPDSPVQVLNSDPACCLSGEGAQLGRGLNVHFKEVNKKPESLGS
jgi:hypothetical protein